MTGKLSDSITGNFVAGLNTSCCINVSRDGKVQIKLIAISCDQSSWRRRKLFIDSNCYINSIALRYLHCLVIV